MAAIQEWLEPDGLLLLESWARDGMTVEQVAAKVGIHKATLHSWMAKHQEIKKAVNNGRELVDYKVENALLKSALGYKTKEVKVITTIRNGKVVKEEKEVTDKEFAPSVGAIQTWLYNRRPDKWKPANAKNSILDGIDEDTNITITVERASSSEIQDGVYSGGSSTFEEPDTDWQNAVNKQVTVRGLSEQEKEEREEKKSQREHQKVPNDEDNDWLDDDGTSEEYDDGDSDWGDDIYEG